MEPRPLTEGEVLAAQAAAAEQRRQTIANLLGRVATAAVFIAPKMQDDNGEQPTLDSPVEERY
jgi:hypothetical protein